LNADGSFKLELDYPFPYQQIWFSIGENFYTSLTVNKDLTLEIDWPIIKAVKDFEFNGKGLRFLGADGPLNHYLNNYILYNRDLQLKTARQFQICCMPILPYQLTSFLHTIKSMNPSNKIRKIISQKIHQRLLGFWRTKDSPPI